MDFNFTREQEMLRKSAAEFLKKEYPFEMVKEIEDSDEGHSARTWKKVAKLEWMGISFPEDYGGLGSPYFDLLIILEEMGKRAVPGPFFSTVVECGLLIQEAGTDEQKEELLKRIASGKLIMALARYEEDADYDLGSISLSASTNDSGVQLNGTKLFVNDANIAQKIIVLAKSEEGPTCYIVDTDTAGIQISKIPSIAHENACEVVFDKVDISPESQLGESGKGLDLLERIFSRTVVAKCAEMVGGCATALEMAADYAKTRVQYGNPIGANQAIQHYLADMKLTYDACLSFFYTTAWMIDQDQEAVKEISALKAMLNEGFNFITDRAVQIFGGVGTTREFDIGLFFQRAKAFELSLGDTEYHHERVAQALGM
jgi:acyl-CoA dehydrogenase